jgi:hypothetical protein
MFLKNIIKVIVIMIFLAFLSGCRTYLMYEYKPTSINILNGRLLIALDGTYGKNYNSKGTNYADYKSPYSLRFTYLRENELPLKGIKIQEIVLIGKSNKNKLFSDDMESWKIKYNKEKGILLISQPIEIDNKNYQNYLLKAKTIVFSDSLHYEELEINLELKTEFHRDYRSDFFDKWMGI